MTDLLAARSQMAISLGFHILFAVAGIAMPLMMVIAEALAQRTGDGVWAELARRWARGTAILFAVGAVSGTVLSFELGLLWPEFMAQAGPVIGLPFAMEGFAFFLEAIFLGLYLYGWDRIPPRVHLASGVMVLISGMLSGIFVVTANAWMNTPAGFDRVDGAFVNIRPWEAMTSPAAAPEALHMTLAALVAVGFAVAAIHAWALLKTPSSPFHRRAFAVALSVGGIAMGAQLLSGHHSAQHVAEHQPRKLAAMEALFETRAEAPLLIGGLPDVEAREVRWALHIPWGLSILSFGDPHATVRGLDAFPEEDWPPVVVAHLAFQVMVGLGSLLAAVAAVGALLFLRTRALPIHPLYLKAVVACGPLGLIAVEAGWTVTEVGRQPYIIQGILRTADAVTPVGNLHVPLATFTLLYLGLGVIVVYLLRRQVFMSPDLTQEERHA